MQPSKRQLKQSKQKKLSDQRQTITTTTEIISQTTIKTTTGKEQPGISSLHMRGIHYTRTHILVMIYAGIVFFPLGQITPRAQRKGPSVLIMCPTRELALQIRDECKKYSYHELKCLCIYGGGNRREQMKLCAEGGIVEKSNSDKQMSDRRTN